MRTLEWIGRLGRQEGMPAPNDRLALPFISLDGPEMSRSRSGSRFVCLSCWAGRRRCDPRWLRGDGRTDWQRRHRSSVSKVRRPCLWQVSLSYRITRL